MPRLPTRGEWAEERAPAARGPRPEPSRRPPIRLSDWRVIAALVVAVVAVVGVAIVVASGGDDGAKAINAVEARMAADDPAGVSSYTCTADGGPEFFCYSDTGNCQGDRRYQVYFDQRNGTFRYKEQAPVRSNANCDG